jgi:Ca2+-binding RTX toxin-like protein
MVGEEFVLNIPTPNSPSGPSVIGLEDGGFVATWYKNVGENYYEIIGRKFDADGTPAGDEFIVNTTKDGFQAEPDITALGDGRFAVTWYSVDDLGIQTRGRVFNADGTAANDFLVPTTNSHVETQPSIASLVDGRFIVSWTSSEGNISHIRSRVFNADGSAFGDDFVPNTTMIGAQEQPNVSGLPDGGFVVSWTSKESSDVDYDIRARTFHANGSATGPDFIVNTTRANTQLEPHVVSVGEGRFVLTWISEEGGPSGYDIRGRVFNADGRPDGADFVINNTTANHQYDLSAASLGGGRFALTWQSDEVGISGSGSPSLDPSVFDIRGVVLAVHRDNTVPVITSDGGGNSAIIVLPENSSDITTVTATDPNLAQALHYTILSGDDAGQFTLDSHTGALSFASAPDFEAPTDNNADNVYEVTVCVDDRAGGSDTQAIAVAVTNVAGIAPALSNAATLIGTNEEDVLRALDGGHTLKGLGGNDSLIAGAGDDVLLGGEGDDWMSGGAGNDMLDGGTGADGMWGAAGDDIYYVDDANDKVYERPGGGVDEVRSSVDYTLGSYAENLTLQGQANGTGNKSDNLLIGSDEANVLQGMIGRDRLEGGGGDDILTGGRESDSFVFKPGFGHDVVTDFAVSGSWSAIGPTHDILEFDSTVFADLDAVFAHSADTADGVLITADSGDTLRLHNVTLAKLQVHPEDFHFV